MAVEFKFSIFEATDVNFGIVFEKELNVDSRVADIFDFELLLIDVAKFS